MLQQINIDELVTKMVEMDGGSDLHLKVGSPPAIRARDLLQRLEGYEVLRPADTADTADMVRGIMSGKGVKAFEEEGEADFSYAVAGWVVSG